MDIPFLTVQQQRILGNIEKDLELWQGKSLGDIFIMPEVVNRNTVRAEYDRVVALVDDIRHLPSDYDAFNPSYDFSPRKPEIVPDFKSPDRIMGRCPCPKDGEETRCCNLVTLDAVQQCGFACSYCSIQSFYSNNQIRVVSDLKAKLDEITLEDGTWHIGTGQSSDSLALSDDFGTLTALSAFARKHPDVIIELKTKSARTDYLNLDIPSNVIFTWSVNAQTVVEKEEHLAASLEGRIRAARKVSEKGHPVGFHIHPMVYYTDWEHGYLDLVTRLVDNIDPGNVVLTGIGTLTFTKSNLKALRDSKRPTLVTKIPLAPIAGKFSYDLEMKRRMFSYVYNLFPSDWKDQVFFYLCMEDPSLWPDVLGRQYACNADFEADMKARYLAKVEKIRNRQ